MADPDGRAAPKFLLTLGVRDLAASTAFYRRLFEREPDRVDPDHARFELDEPPLVLALIVRPKERIAANNAPGLRLADRAAVIALRDRMAALGYKTHTQECTHCGYNEQFRVHVADPDGYSWSAYAVERLIHPNAIHRCLEGEEAILPADPVSRVWELFAGESPPVRIPHDDGTLDEVRLFGPIVQNSNLATEAYRAVRPGGTVVGHGDASDANARLDELLAAGFQGLTIERGRVRGWKPEGPTPTRRLVLYKGPFRQVRDDRGTVYPRSHRVAVDEATWTLLRRGAAAEQFLFLFPYGYPSAGPVRPPAN